MKLEKYTKFPTNQYYQQVTDKKIVVLHHTVSGDGIDGDINWWKQTPERIATPYIISRDAVVTEVFDPKYWAHHLGIQTATLKKFASKVSNQKLNELSIGIELDSWGSLTEKNGKYYSFSGKEIPKENVQVYNVAYRGSKYYEKYTTKQIEALKELLLHINKNYGVKLYYFPEMFNVDARALQGYHGIWSHTSYRSDKSDVHPQPELVEMLKNIKQN